MGRECGIFARATRWRLAGAFGRGESVIEFGSDPPVSEVEWTFVRGETPGPSVDLDRSAVQLPCDEPGETLLWNSAPGLSEMQVR